MDNKYKLLMLIAAVLVIIITAIVIVGLVNGTWPWDSNGWFDGEYHGLPGKNTTATTTQGDSGDSSGTTGENTEQDPAGTTGGNQKPQTPAQKEEGDIVIDLSGTSKPTTGNTSQPTESTGSTSQPTESTGNTSQPTETTGNTSEPTESTGSTSEPTGNGGNQGGGTEREEGDIHIPIDGNSLQFNDLLAGAGK